MNLGMLQNGLILLVTGMTFVLVFLTILICAMHIMSWFVKYLNKLFPEAVEEAVSAVKKTAVNLDDAIALAIAAIAARRNCKN